MKRILICLLALLTAPQHRLRAEDVLRDGEVVQMSLSGPPEEFTREFNLVLVVDEGSVNLPLIGRVRAVGMSGTQLASVIESRLRERKVFTGKVNVAVKPIPNQQTIIVRGAVRAPGPHPWIPGLTLTGALRAAGGYSGSAGMKITRDGKATSYGSKAIKKNPALDPKLQPDDIIEYGDDGAF